VLIIVDFFAIPIGFVAVVTVMVSPREQRLGDMVAGTLVVRERSAAGVVAPARFVPPAGYEAYAGSLDVAAIDEDDYQLVRSYLLRWVHLSPAARDHLGVRLAQPIALRMNHTPPPWLAPHVFLVCVAAAWQRAHGVPEPAGWGAPPPPGPLPAATPPPVQAPPAPPGPLAPAPPRVPARPLRRVAAPDPPPGKWRPPPPPPPAPPPETRPPPPPPPPEPTSPPPPPVTDG
jgi:hypothetical protein